MSASNNSNKLQTEVEKQDLIRQKVRTRQTNYRQRLLKLGLKPTLVRITERAHKQLTLIKQQRDFANLSVTLSYCIESNLINSTTALIPIKSKLSDPVGSRTMPFFLNETHANAIRGLSKWHQLSTLIEIESGLK